MEGRCVLSALRGRWPVQVKQELSEDVRAEHTVRVGGLQRHPADIWPQRPCSASPGDAEDSRRDGLCTSSRVPGRQPAVRRGRLAFLCPPGGGMGVAAGKEVSSVQATGKVAFSSCPDAPGRISMRAKCSHTLVLQGFSQDGEFTSLFM